MADMGRTGTVGGLLKLEHLAGFQAKRVAGAEYAIPTRSPNRNDRENFDARFWQPDVLLGNLDNKITVFKDSGST